MKIAINVTILVLLALQAEIAKAAFDDYQHFRRGTYDFGFETRYEKTTANYLSSGNTYRALPYDQSLELFNYNLKVKYDLSRRSSWYSSLGIASATSMGIDARRTNSGVSDATIGYIFMPYNDTFDLITDFSVLAPFNKISENTDSALNNEGVVQATALLRVQKDFSWLAGYSYIGGTYRQTRSALLPWGVGAEVQTPEWTFGGKVFGFQSITDDADTATKTQRLIVNDRVNGGSLKFYSVNPSWIDSDAYVKFTTAGGLSFAGDVGTTISGSSYAAGMHFGIGVYYAWDSEPRYYLKTSTTEDGIGSERKVRKFQEEVNDGVDQTIFERRRATPPPAATEENVVKPAPVDSGKDMQIKLRKTKRRRN